MQDFKNIGKRAGKVALFLAILFVIFELMAERMEIALIKNDNLVQSRNKSLFRIQREPQDSIDVIVLGDSLSYASISPMELWEEHGITGYVCGQSGQKIQETYHMLETAFETQSPKLVILETNTLFRGRTGLEGIKETIEAWGNYYIPIFRGHDIWKSFLIDKKYPEESYKGFSFRCDVQPYKKGNYMLETEQKEEMPDIVVKYMESIQKLCYKKGAELLLVGTPSPVNCNYRRHNSISAYAESNSLDYLDMNLRLDEIGIDWETDSLDKGDHLNLSGAEKVTKYLGDYLEEYYELPDHRGENSYRGWEKEAQEYEQKAQLHLEQMAAK
ncbi:MAG: SGNH/GDSL hydrolase family protein [Bariatricus sp.]|nr:SGNH/GDSL hydrolase family protein [Bariatricus sp.]